MSKSQFNPQALANLQANHQKLKEILTNEPFHMDPRLVTGLLYPNSFKTTREWEECLNRVLETPIVNREKWVAETHIPLFRAATKSLAPKLKDLFLQREYEMIEAIVDSDITPSDVLDDLAPQWQEVVRDEMIEKIKTFETKYKQAEFEEKFFAVRLAQQEIRSELENNPMLKIRPKIAQHPNTTPKTLHRLVENPEIFGKEGDDLPSLWLDIRAAVYCNEKTESETLTLIYNTSVTEEYMADEYPLCESLAKHPNSGAELLENLVTDIAENCYHKQHFNTLTSISTHPNCSEALREKIQNLPKVIEASTLQRAIETLETPPKASLKETRKAYSDDLSNVADYVEACEQKAQKEPENPQPTKKAPAKSKPKSPNKPDNLEKL